MNWDKTTHDFGTVDKGVTLKAEFDYLGSKTIKEIEPTCNCVGFKLEGNCLKLKWNVKKDLQASVQQNKIVMIVYDDGSLDDLTLTAFVQV